MQQHHFYKNIFVLPTVDSTNSYCLRNINKLPSKTVITANKQTKGRGQRNRNWFSPPNLNIYASIVLKYPRQHKQDVRILREISLAISSTLKKWKIDSWIKWPNDIYVGDRKIAGILIENRLIDKEIEAFIVGIGINVSMTREILLRIEKPATSMTIEVNCPVDKEEVLLNILDYFEHYNNAVLFKDELLHSLWKEESQLLGRTMQIHFSGESFTGIIKDVAYDGSLVFSLNTGEKKTFYSGELTLI